MKSNKDLEAASRRRLLVHGLSAAAAGGLLAACGGSAEPDAGSSAAPLPADRVRRRGLGGVDSGGTGSPMMMLSVAIDATAPLTAGDLRFDTRDAEIVDGEGRPLAEAELARGMSSRIEASLIGPGGDLEARAHRMRVAEQLLGPIARLDLVAGQFVVLGQSVSLGPRTAYDATLPRGRADLQAGAVVRVWGELDPGRARVHATRVSLAAAPTAQGFVVRGLLKSLDRVSGQVSIGGMTAGFDPADAAAVDEALRVGDIVRARLDPSSMAAGGWLLSLRQDGLRLPDGLRAAIEGRITRVDSPVRFSVDGVTVDATSTATWEGTHTPAVGGRAEVRGLVSFGVLLASSLSLEPPEPVQLEGAIATADAATRSFVLRGVVVVWNAGTRFEGGASRLLTARRKAAVTGHWNAEGTRLIADRIHIEA